MTRTLSASKDELIIRKIDMKYQFLAFLAALVVSPAIAADSLPAKVETCFVPAENCENRIVHEIRSARQQILVQAYGFTSAPILSALKSASERGVEVLIILDKTNASRRYSGATYLLNADIPVWIDRKPAIAHNKVMVIDRSRVITGSYNFTASAQKRNAENLVVITGGEVAARFTQNWESRLSESVSYSQTDVSNAN